MTTINTILILIIIALILYHNLQRVIYDLPLIPSCDAKVGKCKVRIVQLRRTYKGTRYALVYRCDHCNTDIYRLVSDSVYSYIKERHRDISEVTVPKELLC